MDLHFEVYSHFTFAHEWHCIHGAPNCHSPCQVASLSIHPADWPGPVNVSPNWHQSKTDTQHGYL